MISQPISHYHIIKKLGAGGMGEVYLAEDSKLGRPVALKLLPSQFTQNADRVRRFEQEARAASALNHPNIITIYEIGEAEAGHFIAIEFVQGRTLQATIAERLSPDLLASVGGQIAKALAVAHAAGIVHRDIKPENIMVRDDGYVKVLDFGLARLTPISTALPKAEAVTGTTPGMLLGTVPYMSPEQARGEDVSSATDLFSLGIVLYEVATGKHPFKTGSQVGTLHAILSEPALSPSRLNPEIPATLDALLLQMLTKDARLRPNAVEVEALLAEMGGKRTRPTTTLPMMLATTRHTVGREKERAELRAGFASASAGRALLLCVAGEPGIGKTTLVEDFLNELAAGDQVCTIARGRSSERLAGTEAYLPWLEALDSLLHHEGGGPIARLMRLVAPTWYAQIAPLATDDSADAPALAEVKAGSQERMKRELGAFFQEVSRLRPLVLFFDDLHWADVSTIDLLAYLASRFASMRMLIVITYRPSDLLLAKHSFLQLKPDLQARGVCREIGLDFLSCEEIEKYLALEFPEHRFSTELPLLIHAKTEGSPLFMADLVRYLRDRQVITQEQGQWVLAQSLPDIERDLPESVRGMIERKIAQLSGEDRRLLVAASVQGYEFDSAVVAQVLAADPAEVEERLEALERVYAFVRLVEEREFPDHTVTLRYRFIHVLYQNALHGSLRPTRKAQLAAAVARALERAWGEQSAGVANELAVLWEAAREFGRAADYFRLAAQNASQVFASREAVALARHGLAMVEMLPDTLERRQRELSLQVVLGNTLIATRGFAAPEVEQTYSRARELCQQLGETPHLPPVLYGLYAFNVVRAKLREALELGEEFLDLTQRQQDPAIVVAHRMMGCPLACLGELNSAREHFEQIASLYDPAQHRALTWLYGNDPGMGGRSWTAWVLWLLGYPDQALAQGQEALHLAWEVRHAHGQAYALAFAAQHHQFRRDWRQVRELAEAVISLAREQGLAMWFAWGTIFRGWAMAEQGQMVEGIDEMRRGLDAFHSTGAELFRPYYLCLLVQAYEKAGQPREGLTVLAEAQTLVERTEERFWEAELHRLRGELLLIEGAAYEEVEQCFHQAIEIARRQSSKSLELRAAMSLTRLWQQQGKRAEAREMLAEIYGWFTEGFDTADLKEARTLLEELA